MYTNVNLAAPIGALAFLSTGLLLFVAGLLLVNSILRKRFWLAKFAVLTIAAIAVLYLAVLLVFSFTSTEKVLARGEEKHFCEIDCHLAYSIADVRETRTLGDGPDQLTSAGVFCESVTHFVIGHENSPLHKKTRFRI
ncbi:MAG TPA: hypothetical protein VF899_07290 [Pyrinomonadaceae bacterium]